ncbi:hypothetical protein ACTA71_009322 [Dictyostelium dimigraforme]
MTLNCDSSLVRDDIDETFINKKNNISIKEFSTDVVFQDFQSNNFGFYQSQQNRFSQNQIHMNNIIIPNSSSSSPPEPINQNNIGIQTSIPSITGNTNNNQNNLNILNINTKSCLNHFF